MASEDKQESQPMEEDSPGVEVKVRQVILEKVALICGNPDPTHDCPKSCDHADGKPCTINNTLAFYWDIQVLAGAPGKHHQEVEDYLHDNEDRSDSIDLNVCMCRVTKAVVTGITMRIEPRKVNFRLMLKAPELNGNKEILTDESELEMDYEGIQWFHGESYTYADFTDDKKRGWTVVCAGPWEERPLVKIIHDNFMKVAHERNHYTSTPGYRYMLCPFCFSERTAAVHMLALRRIRELRDEKAEELYRKTPPADHHKIKAEYAYQKGDAELRQFGPKLFADEAERKLLKQRYEESLLPRPKDDEDEEDE